MGHLYIIIGLIINPKMVVFPLDEEGIIKERLKLASEGLNFIIRKKLLDTRVVNHYNKLYPEAGQCHCLTSLEGMSYYLESAVGTKFRGSF